MANHIEKSDSLRDLAHSVMFWLALVYVVVLLTFMTPYTHQLDAIKEVVIHVLGPILTIAYLAFLALGLLDPPRRGLVITLGAYYGAITISTLFAPAQTRWIAREGFAMQWVLLGPFLAFLGLAGDPRRIRHAVMFLALLTFTTTVLGFLHRGILGNPSAATLVMNGYQKSSKEKYDEIKALETKIRAQRDPALYNSMMKRRQDLMIEAQKQQLSFGPKLFATLSGAGAKGQMMSLILNRNYYASFLLLMIPFALASVFLLPPISWRIFGIIVAFLAAILFLFNLQGQFLAILVPESVMYGAMLLALIPLAQGALARWKNTPFIKIAFVAYLLLAAVFCGLPGWGGIFLILTVPLAGAAYYLTVPSKVWRLAGAICCALALVFLVKFFQYFNLSEHFLELSKQNIDLKQQYLAKFSLNADLAQHYYYGFLYLLWLPVVVASFVRVPAGAWRILAATTVVFGVICLYLTRSKVAMFMALEMELALMVFLLIFPGRFNLGKRWRIVALLIGGAGLGFALLLFSPAGDELVSKLNKEFIQAQVLDFRNPISSRLVIWGGGVGIWKDYPIFGAGLKSFLVLFPEHRAPDYFLYEISHVTIFSHSFFLDLLAESGIVGFTTFMAFLMFLYWKCWRRISLAPDWETRFITICVVGGMTGFLLSNVTSPNARWPICAGNFWAVLGLMAGMVNRPLALTGTAEGTIPWKPTATTKKVIWALCGLSVLGFVWTADFGIDYFKSARINADGLGEIERLKSLKGTLLKEKALMENPKLSSQQRAQAKANYERYTSLTWESRKRAIKLFNTAIEVNPNYITNYYKLGAMYSTTPDNILPSEDLELALKTYRTLESYAPNFSQLRYNFARLYNFKSLRATGAAKKALQKKAAENYRRTSKMTIAQMENTDAIKYFYKIGTSVPSWLLTEDDLMDPVGLVRKLKKAKDPLTADLVQLLSPATRKQIDAYKNSNSGVSRSLKQSLVKDLNEILKKPDFYNEKRFAGADLSPRMRQRLQLDLQAEQIFRLNRSLLAEAYMGLIERHPWDDAVQIGSQVYDAWEEILLKKKPVRMSKISQEEKLLETGNFYSQIALSTGHIEEALAVLERLLSHGLGNEQTYGAIVKIYRIKDDMEGLMKHLKKDLAEKPFLWEARLELVKILYEQGKLREAQEQAIALGNSTTKIADSEFWQFKIFQKAGDPEKARKHGEAFLRLDSASARAQEIRVYLKTNPVQ